MWLLSRQHPRNVLFQIELFVQQAHRVHVLTNMLSWDYTGVHCFSLGTITRVHLNCRCSRKEATMLLLLQCSV